MRKALKQTIEQEILNRTVFTFSKSGNKVRIIELADPYLGQPCVSVERIDTLKRMYVPFSSLLKNEVF